MTDVPTRLLREALRARIAPAPSSGCIDTETLAAWSDGTLSARERAAAESHASSCAQCQALVAAMARTTPWAPPGRWWHTSAFGWLAPLAAAAVTLVLWIYVARAPLEQPVAAPGAAGSASSTSVSAAAASARVPSPATALPPVSDDRAAEPKKTERRNVPSLSPVASAPQRAGKSDEQRAAATAAAQPVFRRPDQANAAPNAMRDTAAAPPAAAPAPPRAEEPTQVATTEAAPTSNAVASAAAAPPPLQLRGATSDRAELRARASALAKVSALPTEIVSPDANVRWRILTGGSVARSTDGGTTWQTQSTGVPVTLTAGTAPSPTMCWLVGPGGIILLSTDGRTWQPVPFPEVIDLTSIRASDGANATVTAADGRTFITSDGGKTWRSA